MSSTVTVRMESMDFDAEQFGIQRLSGHECIGRTFTFDLDVSCRKEDGVAASAILGAGVTLVFEHPDHAPRRIHGIVQRVADSVTAMAAFRGYAFRVVPQLWKAELVQTQDILMGMTIPDVIAEKLGRTGLDEFLELRLTQDYPEHEFVVQYEETDLAFLSRWAEHYGMSMVFEAVGDSGRFVFTDHNGGFEQIADSIPFRATGDRNDVHVLREVVQLEPSAYVMQDYNYRMPGVDLTSTCDVSVGESGGVVEYGGHYKTLAEGQTLAQIRAEAIACRQQVFEGSSGRYDLGAGVRFELDGHPEVTQQLLVVEVHHRLAQAAFGHEHVDDAHYEHTFVAVDASRPYRPPRRTPKPRITGFVTAVIEPVTHVDTPAARVDDAGRYQVKFLFDTMPRDGNSSRAIRMMQPHGGFGHGMHFPLRPDVEVAIGFANGDPDRPVILGALDNPATPSPSVNANQHQNVLSTASGIQITLRDVR